MTLPLLEVRVGRLGKVHSELIVEDISIAGGNIGAELARFTIGIALNGSCLFPMRRSYSSDDFPSRRQGPIACRLQIDFPVVDDRSASDARQLFQKFRLLLFQLFQLLKPSGANSFKAVARCLETVLPENQGCLQARAVLSWPMAVGRCRLTTSD